MANLESEHSTTALSDKEMAMKVAQQHTVAPVRTKYPSETIKLPSKGLVYPKESILSSGEVEMRYLTARDEDILTSRNLISKGASILFDRLLKSIVVTNGVNLNEMIEGDKEALLVAARVLSYGKDYKVSITDPGDEYNTMELDVDLTKDITDKELDDWSIFTNKNEFEMELTRCGATITFCLPTHGSTLQYESEINTLKNLKHKLEVIPDNVIYLKSIIKSVNGDSSPKTIGEFINEIPISDSRDLKKYIRAISPGLDWNQEVTSESTGITKTVEIYPDVDFFWVGLRE